MWLPACSRVAESSSQMQTAETTIAGGCGAMALPQTGGAFLQTQTQNSQTIKSEYKQVACIKH
jgi:hypothetical protein